MERLYPLIDWVRRRVAHAAWCVLALILLFESWLWDNVKEWLRQLERALGLERFETWLENVVAPLSPRMTLVLFGAPLLGLLPIKLAALALLAHGHILVGVALILLAKTLALGVEAFLFDICRNKLLEIEWFAQFYSIVLDVRAWASLLVRPYRARATEFMHRLQAYAKSLLGKNGDEFTRRIARLRELAKAKPPA
jgi:hypothetical protein